LVRAKLWGNEKRKGTGFRKEKRGGGLKNDRQVLRKLKRSRRSGNLRGKTEGGEKKNKYGCEVKSDLNVGLGKEESIRGLKHDDFL